MTCENLQLYRTPSCEYPVAIDRNLYAYPVNLYRSLNDVVSHSVTIVTIDGIQKKLLYRTKRPYIMAGMPLCRIRYVVLAISQLRRELGRVSHLN